MTTAEGRLIARIREMEQEIVKRIHGAAESEKEAIEKWANDYIAGLNIELPFSVKQILDRGGAVRSFAVEASNSEYLSRLAIQLQVEGTKDGYTSRRMDMPEMESTKPGQQFLITVLVEPQA